MRDFRFSCNIFGISSREAFAAECREAEQLGYDTVFAPDHLGVPAPFPLLVALVEELEDDLGPVDEAEVAKYSELFASAAAATPDHTSASR